jgi:hypothetical protein
MRCRTLWIVVVAAVSTAALAGRGGRFLDDTSVIPYLQSRTDGMTSKSAYKVNLVGTVVGPKDSFKSQDIVRLDWKQNGKTLASVRCPLGIDASQTTAEFKCEQDEAKLTAAGKVQAEVYYVDDRAGKTELLSKLNLEVGRYYNWSGMDGKKPKHEIRFQLIGDGLLGTTFLWMSPAGVYRDHGPPKLRFFTWLRRDNDKTIANSVLRCSVGGKTLSEDAQAYPLSGLGTPNIEVGDRQYVKGPPDNETLYRWERVHLVADLYWGPRKNNYANPEKMIWVGEHPGDWSCAWRWDGKALREFTFTVDAKGSIKPHAEQATFNLPPNTFFIETRFSKPVWDTSFNPAAIKAAAAFGRPWSNPASLKTMFSALPPAKGTSVPKPAKNAK